VSAGARRPDRSAPRRALVTGAAGQLGTEVVARWRLDERAEVVAADHRHLPVDDADLVAAAVDAIKPDVVIHCAALTDVDRCEREPALALAVNARGTSNLVRAAVAVRAHIVCVSTDYVFDGRSTRPYTEADQPNPISVYGRSKLEGERACPPEATVVRTSWLFGVGPGGFVPAVLRRAREPGDLEVVVDQRASPTYTSDLARAVVELARDRRPGCFHVTNTGEASRYELAREVLALSGENPDRVRPITTAELVPPPLAPRPGYSVLDNSAFVAAGYRPLPDWRDALARLLGRLVPRAP
jgi:dTDP-4-dehydrorhamnose reductase